MYKQSINKLYMKAQKYLHKLCDTKIMEKILYMALLKLVLPCLVNFFFKTFLYDPLTSFSP